MSVEPKLTLRPAQGPTGMAVLVLPGGRAESMEPSRARHLSVVRMRPFATALSRAHARHGVAVASLRYRVRGWNGAQASPVADARWALGELRDRFGPVPVILVGHSMGGRTALRVADDPAVIGVVALAPWLPPGEPRARLGDRPLLVVHGTADRWTDPAASRDYVEAAVASGTPARWVPMPGHGHFMLRARRRWRQLVTDFVTDLVEQAGPGLTSNPSHTSDRPGRPRS